MKLIDADRLEHKLGILWSQGKIPNSVLCLIRREIKDAKDDWIRFYAEGYRQGRFDEAMDRDRSKDEN